MSLILEVKINEKPFSANKMHYATGKRDTKAYREFKEMIHHMVHEEYDIDPSDKLRLTLVTGFSSKLSDLDNAFKPLLDSMQRAMGFDDRQIFEINACKQHTKKGQEFIMVRLEKIDDVTQKILNMFPSFT